MLAVRIPDEMESRLDKLATLTGRPKSFYVREALETHLDEIEETYTALYRLEHPAKRWTLEELEQELDRPSDKDPSPGTPTSHPNDKDQSLGAPA